MGEPTPQCLKTQPSVEYGCEVKPRSTLPALGHIVPEERNQLLCLLAGGSGAGGCWVEAGADQEGLCNSGSAPLCGVRGLCAFCFCTRGNCFGIRAVEEGYPRLR